MTQQPAAWNGSASMKKLFTHAPVSTVVRATRAVVRNPADKSVCSPHAIPLFKKTSTVVERSTIFQPVDASAQAARVPTRGKALHTDPFDVSRHSEYRPMYGVYGALPHKEPHAEGMRHVPPPSFDNKGFVSLSGYVSFGGRRHTAGPESNEQVKSPMRKRVVSPSRSPSRSPLTLEGPPMPTKISPCRRRSPVRDQPTLVGVMKPVSLPAPKEYVVRAAWFQSSPPPKTTTTATATANAADSAQVPQSTTSGAAASQALRPLPTDNNTVGQRKALVSNKVRAPFHTDTPRGTECRPVRTVAPFHTD